MSNYRKVNYYKIEPDVYESEYIDLLRKSKNCQPYVCPNNYKKKCNNGIHNQDGNCISFGYQPKRENPGGLKFYMYDYPFQTQGGVPLTHPGKGWYKYEESGVYKVPLNILD